MRLQANGTGIDNPELELNDLTNFDGTQEPEPHAFQNRNLERMSRKSSNAIEQH